jgi:hypothetical protein
MYAFSLVRVHFRCVGKKGGAKGKSGYKSIMCVCVCMCISVTPPAYHEWISSAIQNTLVCVCVCVCVLSDLRHKGHSNDQTQL